MPKNWLRNLKQAPLWGKPILRKVSVPISQLTTFQSQGVVQEVQVFQTLDALKAFIKSKVPYYILGKGSNTLISPDTSIHKFIQISLEMFPVSVEGNRLRVCAGTTVHKLMGILQEKGLTGLEFSAGVPASIGGMVAMNFGCWGQDISQILVKARILTETGDDKWVSNLELGFGYRTSILQKNKWICLEAEFACQAEDPAIIKQTILQNIQTRIEKQPLKGKTFGSVFKNPPGFHAAALLEELGFKGKTINHVQFSEKHANFLINMGDAKFQDALAMIQLAQDTVSAQKGILLEPEVKIVL